MNAQLIEDGSIFLDESMSITRADNNIYDITLNTITTIKANSSNGKQRNALMPLHQEDALLLDIMHKFDLSSLSISISETSLGHEKSFPVGTAIQFKLSHGNADDDIEYDLVRILSYKNLLCESVEKELFFSGKIRAVLKPDGSKIIMLPNDAYSLCHSRELIRQIISSSPCRNTAGVFSQIQPNINEFDIVNKAAWVEVTRLEDKFEIDKGLRFGRIVPEGKTNAAQLLGGDGDYLNYCPLATKSTLVLQNNEVRDLQINALDMYEVIEFEVIQGRTNSLGIERINERINGMSNDGQLITRVYIGHEAGAVSCPFNDNLFVRLVDTFPNVINPIYHSLKISLVTGHFAGADSSTLKKSLEDNKQSVNELHLDDITHDLKLSHDGSGVLSVSTTMPKDSSLYIQVDYKPKYLNFEAFPAGPNRGFDVCPSMVTFSCHPNMTSTSPTTSMYSNALLIMPPVPDLSMPFNVISIVCTFFALIIGTTINLTIRKSRESIADKFNGIVKPTLKDRLREKLQRLTNKVSKRRTAVSVKNDVKDKVE